MNQRAERTVAMTRAERQDDARDNNSQSDEDHHSRSDDNHHSQLDEDHEHMPRLRNSSNGDESIPDDSIHEGYNWSQGHSSDGSTSSGDEHVLNNGDDSDNPDIRHSSDEGRDSDEEEDSESDEDGTIASEQLDSNSDKDSFVIPDFALMLRINSQAEPFWIGSTIVALGEVKGYPRAMRETLEDDPFADDANTKELAWKTITANAGRQLYRQTQYALGKYRNRKIFKGITMTGNWWYGWTFDRDKMEALPSHRKLPKVPMKEFWRAVDLPDDFNGPPKPLLVRPADDQDLLTGTRVILNPEILDFIHDTKEVAQQEIVDTNGEHVNMSSILVFDLDYSQKKRDSVQQTRK